MSLRLNPRWVFGLIALFYLSSFLYYQMWNEGARGGDPLGYYLYLPASLLYHDLGSLQKSYTALKPYLKDSPGADYFEETDLVNQSDQGNSVIKYTAGLALTQLPAFTISHLGAKIFHYPADGFSKPYIFGIYLTGFLFGLWGLWITRKILLHYFSPKLTLITLIAIALGTNFYFFTVYHSVMAHATLFFFFALLIYSTIQMLEKPRRSYAVYIGVALGMITLIRPSEGIAFLIPLFWGVRLFQKASWLNRWQWIKNHRNLILLILVIAFLCCLPQFIYWKAMTGSWIYYSYSGEGFDFANPKIIDGLFSYRNGWLAYTPIMIFAIAGIFIKSRIDFLRPLLLSFFVLHIYITYSWWCWNYINGFGSRPMVETSTLMALPLAAFAERIKHIRWLTIISFLISIWFVFMNLFNTWQYSRGLMWSEMGTRAYYYSMVGKTSLNSEDLILYDCGEHQPTPDKLTYQETLLKLDFNSDGVDTLGRTAYSLDNHQGRNVILHKTLADLNIQKGDFIKVQFQAMKPPGLADIYQSAYLAVRLERQGRGLKTRRIRINNKIHNPTHSLWGNSEGYVWDTITFYYQVHKVPQNADLVIYLENYESPSIWIDELVVDVLK